MNAFKSNVLASLVFASNVLHGAAGGGPPEPPPDTTVKGAMSARAWAQYYRTFRKQLEEEEQDKKRRAEKLRQLVEKIRSEMARERAVRRAFLAQDEEEVLAMIAIGENDDE